MNLRSVVRCCVAATVVLAAGATVVRAEVRPHGLISDGMVLQRGRPAAIFGTAVPQERVTVRFRGKEQSTTTGDDGRWRLEIDPQEAGGPFELTIVGTNTVSLTNVLVGDVWVCSGQSNMGWPLAARPGSQELANTANPSIRSFTVPQRLADSPTDDVEGAWQVCGPATLVGFSAVAYYFGRDIQATQQVPIGLIHASYGGSGVGQWLSERAFADDPGLAEFRARQTDESEKTKQQRERLKPEIERYEAAVARAKADGTAPPQPPRGYDAGRPVFSRLYNGMIAPLHGFAIRGVLWYQGEANVNRPGDYRALFTALIRSWRSAWRQDDLPFLFVQIAPFQKIVERPQESNWAALREAQLQVSRTVPHTGMAVITDWGHETDIHVKQKEPVGRRLALLARALVYGEHLVYSGPLFATMQIDGAQARLTFEHIGGGLTAKRLVLENIAEDPRTGTGGALHVAADDNSTTPVALQGFTIAGDDRVFVPAEAKIVDNAVIVSSPQVAKPAAVRYGWADYPTGNLFNREGLPASPFRTDDWPLTTSPPPTGR